jgi:hypothetical protein
MGEGPEVVVVCGAGAAGLAAALSAARSGAEVCLIEAGPSPGGTVTNVLIHTLGGFFDSAGELLNGGLPADLAQALTGAGAARRRIGRTWVLSVCPEQYRAVAQGWIAAEPRIRLFCRTRLTNLVRAAGHVPEVELSGPRGTSRLRARAVIDATGTAEVVRALDRSLLQEDRRRAAGGLMVTLRGVAPGTLAFPRGVGVVRALRRAAETGDLPAECAKAWVDAGVQEDEVYVKLFVPLPEDWREGDRREEITRAARDAAAGVVSFLKQLPEFAHARVGRLGALGIRDGGRIRGDYCLTGADVRRGARFADPAGRCCWPIEYWDPDKGVQLEYLPDNTWYEIPLRALQVPGYRNVWAAGKCLSADHEAQASARVVGACWAMGEAVGKAAAVGGRG